MNFYLSPPKKDAQRQYNFMSALFGIKKFVFYIRSVVEQFCDDANKKIGET